MYLLPPLAFTRGLMYLSHAADNHLPIQFFHRPFPISLLMSSSARFEAIYTALLFGIIFCAVLAVSIGHLHRLFFHILARYVRPLPLTRY